MSGVCVAVVDSGIHVNHPHIQSVLHGICIDSTGRETPDWNDRIGHGTAVAAAIHDFEPSAELLAVRVFERSLTASVSSLVAAIEWSVLQGANLINLSLGVSESRYTEVMRKVVSESARAGSIIVAAGRDAAGVDWLPGSLEGVVRVELDWGVPRGQFVSIPDSEGVVFRTSGYPRSIPGIDPEYNLKGLSFAVATMTGLAARAMTRKSIAGYTDLITVLHQQANQ